MPSPGEQKASWVWEGNKFNPLIKFFFNLPTSEPTFDLPPNLLHRMFRRMDDDGSKSLQFQEFSKGIRDTGLECTNEEAKEMFNTFDKDKSGSVNIDEFLLAIRVRFFFIENYLLI